MTISQVKFGAAYIGGWFKAKALDEHQKQALLGNTVRGILQDKEGYIIKTFYQGNPSHSETFENHNGHVRLTVQKHTHNTLIQFIIQVCESSDTTGKSATAPEKAVAGAIVSELQNSGHLEMAQELENGETALQSFRDLNVIG